MVLGSDCPKELYILTSVEDLRTRALEREFLINFQTRTRYFRELEILHIHIEKAFHEKDQEKEFIYLCRFLQVIDKMDPSDKRFKGKLIPAFKIYEVYERKHRDRLGQLEKILKQRYEELKSKKSLNSSKSSSINSDFSATEPISRIIQPPDVSLVDFYYPEFKSTFKYSQSQVQQGVQRPGNPGKPGKVREFYMTWESQGKVREFNLQVDDLELNPFKAWADFKKANAVKKKVSGEPSFDLLDDDTELMETDDNGAPTIIAPVDIPFTMTRGEKRPRTSLKRGLALTSSKTDSGKEDMELDKQVTLRSLQQKCLKLIKDLNPKTRLLGKKRKFTRLDNSNSSDYEEPVPLRSHGVGRHIRRSLSSPDISMKETSGNRSNIPCYSPRGRQTPALLLVDNPEAVYGNTPYGLTGLKNFANNCYMNSIIQCLSNTVALKKELTNLHKPVEVNPNSETKGQIANLFIRALQSIWCGKIKVFSLGELKNQLGNHKEIFLEANHQDAHEFLTILLEYLHKDLYPLRMVSPHAEKENWSIIQRLFYGKEQSSVTCTTCRYRSVTFNHFFNLSVPIPDGDRPTLEECIQEYLSDENVIWKCPKCKVDRNAVKKLDIIRLPLVLIIAFKRFIHKVSWLQKKETLVTYPLVNLEMEHHTLAESEHQHTSYNLHALSLHNGSLQAGHYRAICRNHILNKWFVFDDSAIHPVLEQEVQNNPNVYILFYHLV